MNVIKIIGEILPSTKRISEVLIPVKQRSMFDASIVVTYGTLIIAGIMKLSIDCLKVSLLNIFRVL